MKDAKGHGSDPRGMHTSKLQQIGNLKLHPQAIMTARNALLHSGGFSVKPSTGASPKSGYMVSIPGHSKIIAGDVDEKSLASYAKEHSDALSQPGAHIGGWQHEGNTYLDVSQNIRGRNAAIIAGKKNNQIAIYDVKHGSEIQTGGDGTS